MVDAALTVFSIMNEVKNKLYQYEQFIRRAEFFSKDFGYLMKNLEDLQDLLNEEEKQQTIQLGRFVVEMGQSLDKFLSLKTKKTKGFLQKVAACSQKAIQVATIDQEVIVLQDQLQKLQQGVIALNTMLMKKILEETQYIREDIKDIRETLKNSGKEIEEGELKKVEKQFQDHEAMELWLELFGSSLEINPSLFFQKFYDYLVKVEGNTNIKDSNCLALVLRDILDSDQNGLIACSEFDAFYKDTWKTKKASLLREIYAASKDDVKATKLAISKGFSFNIKPILEQMPTLLFNIETVLYRRKKDANDFEDVDVIKIFANGKTEPSSKADFQDEHTVLFGRLYEKEQAQGLPRTLDFSLTSKDKEISRHQFSVSRDVCIVQENMQIRYTLRDIANNQSGYLKVERIPYLLQEDMDFSLGNSFCIRILSATPRPKFERSDTGKYFNVTYFKEEQLRNDAEYIRQVEALQNFIKEQKIPPRLVIQVNPYFKEKLKNCLNVNCVYVFQLEQYNLNKIYTIGSDEDCDIVTDTTGVLPKHCEIGFSTEYNAWYIQDLEGKDDEDKGFGTLFCLSDREYESIYVSYKEEQVDLQKQKLEEEAQELEQKLKDLQNLRQSQIEKKQNQVVSEEQPTQDANNNNEVQEVSDKDIQQVEEEITQKKKEVQDVKLEIENHDPKRFTVILEKGMLLQVQREDIHEKSGDQLLPWRFRIDFEKPVLKSTNSIAKLDK